MSKFYVSAFYVFDTEHDRNCFMADCILPLSKPNGGPCFSYSIEDESQLRDNYTRVCASLEQLQKEYDSEYYLRRNEEEKNESLRTANADLTEENEKLKIPDNDLRNYATSLRKMVDKLDGDNKALVDVLERAKQKLEIYRKQVSNEYQGGTEYSHLMELIETALKTHGGK